MVDLGKTVAPKSDQLNADDMIAGPMTIEITNVKQTETPEQPIAYSFKGDNGKPFIPCKSMRRVLIQVWGRDGLKHIGRSMTLFREPTVKFGGMEVGGIRISHVSHIDKPMTMALTATKASRKPFTVQPLKIAQTTPSKASSSADNLSSDFDPAAGGTAAANGKAAYLEWWSERNDAEKAMVGADQHKAWSQQATAVSKAATIDHAAPGPSL